MNERENNRSNNQIHLNVIQFQYIFKKKIIELYRIESVFCNLANQTDLFNNHKGNRRNLNQKKKNHKNELKQISFFKFKTNNKKNIYIYT